MSWEFKVGQKVVCVHDYFTAPLSERTTVIGLTKGGVYAINRVWGPAEYFFYNALQGEIGISVNDVSSTWMGEQWPLASFRFRPLVTDTQPWLAEILAPKPAFYEWNEAEFLP